MTLHCKFYYLFKYRNIGRHVRFEDFRFPIFISHGSYRFLFKKCTFSYGYIRIVNF